MNETVDIIYSIGYSGFDIKDFIGILKSKQISIVIDVRSQPYSQRYPEYNKENLSNTLMCSGIYYRNYAKEFGARQDDRCFYTDEGYLDFDLFAKSPGFSHGFKKLIDSMERDYVIALMCAEKDPINCHRAILVSRVFAKSGYRVVHILPDNAEMTQADIESRLLNMYFPDRNQITLFDEALDDNDYLALAYKKRNSEIGYSIREERK